MMPTFVDESGDTGAPPPSTSPYFRLTAVHIPTHDDAEALREQIRQVRKDLGLPSDFEFKYSKTGSRVERRRAFFEAVIKHPIRFVVASLDKTSDEWKLANRLDIHAACAVVLSAYLAPVYRESEAALTGSRRGTPLGELVVVDDNKDKPFLDVMKVKFAKLPSAAKEGAYLVKKVRFQNSGPDEMLQVADMICGAAGDHLDGNSVCFEQIKLKCVEICCIA